MYGKVNQGPVLVGMNVGSTTGSGPPPWPLPNCNITSPSTGPLSGLSVTINVNASATVPETVDHVDFSWQYCPAGNCGAEQALTPDPTAPYSAVWTFPSCGAAPEDRFRILARATDSLGGVSQMAGVDVRLTGRGC